MSKKKINYIKVVVKQHKTNKWLTESLLKYKTTISHWCRNMKQPSLEIFFNDAEVPKYLYYIIIIYDKTTA